MRNVFVTGGTGYMGSRLIPALVERGHLVRAMARQGSVDKLPPGCEGVVGDALSVASVGDRLGEAETFVHLVGVANPSPRKASQFRSIDLASARAAIDAARRGLVRHFVYVSVAQPAPVMRAFVEARREAEEALDESGLAYTVLRPWYVLGPGHRWPIALAPLYWLGSVVPAWREGSERLGLVTISQMVAALVNAVEEEPQRARIVDVPSIRTST
ncbi:MAG TPA: NAD(P)H-binding protein, partial [Polyangiaceae bacterium]